MNTEQLIAKIKATPDAVEFNEVMDTIEQDYHYQPSTFSNGLGDNKITNTAGSNEGSCKIFAFAKINQLNKEETLACFGQYYRDDVLKHPDGDDHGNIRNFMRDGWDGIDFESVALKKK